MIESLCCSLENIKTLLIGYFPIQNKKFKYIYIISTIIIKKLYGVPVFGSTSTKLQVIISTLTIRIKS